MMMELPSSSPSCAEGIVRRGSADNGKGDLVGGSGSKVAPAGGGGGNGGDSPPKEGGAAGGAVLSIVPTTNGAGSAVADDVAADSLARAVLADRRTSHRVNSRAVRDARWFDLTCLSSWVLGGGGGGSVTSAHVAVRGHISACRGVETRHALM